jgi:hypothetical protein
MSNQSNAVLTPPPTTLTIRDREERMERALDLLRAATDATPATLALEILRELRILFAPSGYRPTVQLEEEGRKKRATAAETNWRFDRGEIVIFHEPINGLELVPIPVPEVPPSSSAHTTAPSVSEEEVRQCCEALAEAEKAGKQFIGYKWFRDLALAGLRYPWAATSEGRARVLKEAIDRGGIETRKIPNPTSPMYPTTTVRLVPREQSPVKLNSRFSPVPIKGEPASVTLLRDRGTH